MDNKLNQPPWWHLTWREFLALLVAGTWDAAQAAAFAATAGGGLSPINLGGSAGVALVLAYLLGPSVVLLPIFILENIPMFDELPTTTAGVFFIIWQERHKQLPPPSSSGGGEIIG